jgi:hypothetical protein
LVDAVVTIRQLNAAYVREEDRVLLRFTTLRGEEYRLWLTRAVMGSLLQLLTPWVTRSEPSGPSLLKAGAMAAGRQKQPQEGAQMGAQPVRFEGSANLPLGAEPVLVKAAQASWAADQGEAEARHPVLRLQLTRSNSLSLRLNEDLAGKLQVLIQRMDEVAAWNLQATSSDKAGQSLSLQAHKTSLVEEEYVPRKVLH